MQRMWSQKRGDCSPGWFRLQSVTRRRRLVRVTHRVVFGTLEAVEHVLAACGWHINTAFIERLNLRASAFSLPCQNLDEIVSIPSRSFASGLDASFVVGLTP